MALEPEIIASERWPVLAKEFLVVDVTYKNWDYDNRGKNKYAIVNAKSVLAEAGLNPNLLKSYLKDACREILDNTNWPAQWPNFAWGECGPKQVEGLDGPRPDLMHFEKAVTVIVAMDIAAVRRRSAVRPIDTLRILPACSYVDGFDKARLIALRGAPLPEGLVSPEGQEFTTFDQHALLAMAQQPTNRSLLDELAGGKCATQLVAEKLRVSCCRFHGHRV